MRIRDWGRTAPRTRSVRAGISIAFKISVAKQTPAFPSTIQLPGMGQDSMNHASDLRPVAGFARMDLCFAVAALGLLATVAIPILANPAAGSRSLLCMDNLRRLTAAWTMYADDQQGRLILNRRDSEARSPLSGKSGWAMGEQDWSVSSANTNTAFVTDDRYTELAAYTARDPDLFWCPADRYLSRSQIALGWSHRVRSYAMNYFIGFTGSNYFPEYQPYNDLTDFRRLSPSRALLLIEEHPDSSNDPSFFFNMTKPEWYDYPASHHDGTSWVSFVDGHLELRQWQSASTLQPVRLTYRYVGPAGEPDYSWLKERLSESR